MNSYKKISASLIRAAQAGVFVLVLAGTVSACAPRVDTRGNQLDPDNLAAIKPGETSRNTVLDKLGTPSSRSNFGDETWYYISEVTETTAFMAPEVKDRTIVVVKFDDAGLVNSLETVDATQVEAVEPAEGETPTAGNSLGFFEQIIANIGRFNR